MKKTRILALFLVLCLTVACIPAIAASAAETGNDFAWNLTDGVLTVSGTVMPDDAPWSEFRKDIHTVVIQDGMTNIGNRAFSGCTNLTNVTIPDSVTGIGEGAFDGCSSLASIEVAEGNPAYCSIGGILYDHEVKQIIAVPGGITGSVEIPESVTSIGKGAFANCSGLTSITISGGVIGEYAFHSCSSLTDVTISDGVTYIGYASFASCSSLTSITIPGSAGIGNEAFWGRKSLTNVTILEGNTFIGQGAFGDCSSLTNVTISDGITGIADGAFYHCSSLREVRFLGDRPDLAFDVFPKDTIVYYPAGNATWDEGKENNPMIGGRQPWQPYGGYQITDGENSAWTEGRLTFRADGAMESCTAVCVDGTILDSANYDLQSGSTIVSLHEAYLKTLSEGEHILRVLFTDGTAETVFTVKSAESVPTEPKPTDPAPTDPNPTDGSNPATGGVSLLPIALLLVASAAATTVCLKKRRTF